MTRDRIGGIFALLLVTALAACAAPNVDRAAAGFDNKAYCSDVNRCHGKSAIEVAPETTGAGLWGSFFGAYHGLYLGFTVSGKAEGIIFGAIVGTGARIGMGAVESIREFKMRSCDMFASEGLFSFLTRRRIVAAGTTAIHQAPEHRLE
ncbi:MAG: hypothetical protein O3B21_14640 [Proteobacteria bacterium]|nr:hypothetical protein [Pseudomonadota bacterium]MDA1354955.1 hypothetical protein [Pseudomonadota bacterium]